MTVFPARPALPMSSQTLATVDRTHPSLLEDTQRMTTPAEWARRRRAERGARRIEAAGARALTRLDRLGPNWHIVDWPRTDLTNAYYEPNPADERAGFLAIGPGGVYAVTVADHGRSRVLIAGDVVQINGKRPEYVAEARRDGRRAAKAISAVVGLNVPVTPVLTFVGSGVISVHGLPKDCLVSTDKELDRLLIAGGGKISPATAAKLTAVAQHPGTWSNAPWRPNHDYSSYGSGQTTADKRLSRR
ncbi:hypothetical protein GCM10010112_74680 [Actinoplanes lobatus]|uniref:NERD domain-containing protein n=1 Tax=Actinoplanes lobatus TaxID=113568 RepID=A0A7W7MF29_9ACTN|nr:hypothetical protein [Actinoplanes lobatus]MBB4747826.1 hypothetical protein [Actinoplanes lobatus]GGN89850.1 hypothetical protein GCM10010112_74680 [Actinoplanes lobatus]GIE43743.1 hypothetical protein Alo02nite_66410 [Actinoplanes lobatus]